MTFDEDIEAALALACDELKVTRGEAIRAFVREGSRIVQLALHNLDERSDTEDSAEEIVTPSMAPDGLPSARRRYWLRGRVGGAAKRYAAPVLRRCLGFPGERVAELCSAAGSSN
ncbi:hypothetical protein [Sinorhizobium fredii]|uniref:hypothetical protein n=1 Tax=Rhizobium fredii TaxID=380 RepID=UPI003510DB62